MLSAAGVDLSVERYTMEKKSTLFVVGLSVHRTPVELRERLAIPEAEAPRVVEELCAYPHIQEAAVLSTCNRLEVYVVARSFHPAVREVEAWLCAASGVRLEELRPSLFAHRGDEATEHLMRVAAGLDSLVVGEGQILAQVRQVHVTGQGLPHFGRVLNAVFKAAVTVGKRVRSETAISEGAVSVSGAAAELAALKLAQAGRPPLEALHVVVIGAGKMGRLLLKHLQAKGVRAVTVVNRSLPRAEALAAEFPDVDMVLTGMPGLVPALRSADVVFCASGAGDVLLREADAAALPTRERLMVDISVPRNVHPDVGGVPGAALYNVDDLKEVVASNLASRAVAVRAAEGLIEAEVAAFGRWKGTLDAVPRIRALRQRGEAVKAEQLEKYLGKLGAVGGGLSEEQEGLVRQLAHSVVAQLLHEPTAALRQMAAQEPGGHGDAVNRQQHRLEHGSAEHWLPRQ